MEASPMGKRVEFDDHARESLWRGVDQLAHAVRITLGPRGRSVVFDRMHGGPAITRDGIAVASEIELPDAFENLGVQMLREVALQTGQVAGDGTSTATVLAHRMVGDGLRAVAAGHNPVAVKRGIERAVEVAVRDIAAHARPVDDHRDLERVAVLAAGDRALGELLAHAIERVGRHGIVTIEEGRGLDTVLEVVEGTRFDGGYASPYFITDADDMEASLEHPLVMLVDGKLTRAGQIVPALEHAVRAQRPLLVLCEEIEGEALTVLVVNRLRAKAASIAIKLEQAPARRRELLDDLALLTGGELVAPDLGKAPEQFQAQWFGRARHVSVTSDHTTLLQGGGRNEALAETLTGLRNALARAARGSSRELLRQRIARLGGGIAVIRVGAATEVEMHARRAQLEDALGATRAAVEEGVVPGGGLALLRAADAVRDMAIGAAHKVGRDIVLAALLEPARQIGINAGEDGGVVVERMRAGEGAYGYNAVTGAWGDLVEQGIIDPAKVVRCALQHAASIGTLVLTTDALVVDDGDDEAGEE
jgi:chaperonin GroEL